MQPQHSFQGPGPLAQVRAPGGDGIDGDGTVDADVSLDVPAGCARPGPDYATASGNVRLGGKGLAIQGARSTSR